MNGDLTDDWPQMDTARITFAELRNRLARAGHATTGDAISGAALWPAAETIITIGANLDPTLCPEYRSRYFACYVRSPKDPTPLLRDDSEFVLPDPFSKAAAECPAPGAFLDGPFRWLLARILKFGLVLLWPAAERPDGQREVVILDLHRDADCRVLWKAASDVAQSSSDVFVSDLDCREVYRLHHQDKVVVAVADDSARQELLEDLAQRCDLFEDCSGYVTDWDDENGGNDAA